MTDGNVPSFPLVQEGADVGKYERARRITAVFGGLRPGMIYGMQSGIFGGGT